MIICVCNNINEEELKLRLAAGELLTDILGKDCGVCLENCVKKTGPIPDLS